jgi:hypothetical protein
MRLLQLLIIALFSLTAWLTQPAFADANQSPSQSPSQNVGQNATGQPIQEATDSDLSDIPDLEQADYDTFQEYFGKVPGDHVPLFNSDNPKLQVKDKTPGSNQVITTEDLKKDGSS